MIMNSYIVYTHSIYTQPKKESFLSSKSFLFFICRREENVVRTYVLSDSKIAIQHEGNRGRI